MQKREVNQGAGVPCHLYFLEATEMASGQKMGLAHGLPSHRPGESTPLNHQSPAVKENNSSELLGLQPLGRPCCLPVLPSERPFVMWQNKTRGLELSIQERLCPPSVSCLLSACVHAASLLTPNSQHL